MKNSTKLLLATCTATSIVAIEYYKLCNKAFNLVFKMQNKAMLPDNNSMNKETPALKWFNQSKVYDAWITSVDDLKLNAIKIKNHALSHKWAILIRGYDALYTDMLDQALEFDRHNFNVLLISNRGFGISGGKYTTMGYMESDDTFKWINYIKNIDDQAEIVLYGVSLGASIVMMTLGKEHLNGVVCAIEDCGYSSLIGELQHMSKKYMKMPLSIIKMLLDQMVKNRLHFKMEDVNCMHALSYNVIPTMFIHGEADDTVPFNMVYDNYNANRGYKEIYTVKGAGHNQCKYDKDYYNRIFEFINHFII